MMKQQFRFFSRRLFGALDYRILNNLLINSTSTKMVFLLIVITVKIVLIRLLCHYGLLVIEMFAHKQEWIILDVIK